MKDSATIIWKRKDDQWMLYGPANLIFPGATVTVTKKDGTTTQEKIINVYSTRAGMSYAHHEVRPRPASTPRPSNSRNSYSRSTYRGKRTGCSCGSIEDYPRDSDCRSCQFENFDQ